MGNKTGRNDKCPCGSGKKYKKCCLNTNTNKPIFKDQQEWNEWVERVSNYPARAEITSKNGAEGSMKVASARVVKDGKEEILFNDEIELMVNSVQGDEIGESKAIFIAPQNNEEPKVITLGNASVTNSNTIKEIALFENKKKLRAKSDSGLFASAQIGFQRNTGLHYFQLYFGVKGKEEKIDETGTKNRPHIDFYPSGNGKYIRLSDYKCKLVVNSGYDKSDKTIFPSMVSVVLEGYEERLELEFTYDDDKAILKGMTFYADHEASPHDTA